MLAYLPFFHFILMKFFIKWSLCAALLLLGVPAASAKIYPDDFLIPERKPVVTEPEPTPPPPSPSQPFFYASEIPNGRLTRAQFVDAVSTRLYDADAHDGCFGDLVLSEAYDYHLLFNDVSLDAPYASSICVPMRNGIVQGYSDGRFRPEKPVTVAEAAAVFGDIGGLPLADSNHVPRSWPWYQRYMNAMRAVDREFTMNPWDILTGAHLKHTLCVLKRYTPALDPLGEFTGC